MAYIHLFILFILGLTNTQLNCMSEGEGSKNKHTGNTKLYALLSLRSQRLLSSLPLLWKPHTTWDKPASIRKCPPPPPWGWPFHFGSHLSQKITCLTRRQKGSLGIKLPRMLQGHLRDIHPGVLQRMPVNTKLLTRPLPFLCPLQQTFLGPGCLSSYAG